MRKKTAIILVTALVIVGALGFGAWKGYEWFIARMTPQNISCDIPLWASEEQMCKGERPKQFLKRILAKHGKSEKPKSRFFSEESGALVRYAKIILEAKE